MDTLNATGNALLESLISTKEQLSDAAENFNSQNIFHDANANLVLAVNATFSGAESVVDDLGVFESLDSIVQGAALTPLKINKIADVSSFFIDGSEPEQVPEIDLEKVPRHLENLVDESAEPEQFHEIDLDYIVPRNFEKFVDESVSQQEESKELEYLRNYDLNKRFFTKELTENIDETEKEIIEIVDDYEPKQVPRNFETFVNEYEPEQVPELELEVPRKLE